MDISFWCGVAATLIVETVALMVATVWLTVKKKREGGSDA